MGVPAFEAWAQSSDLAKHMELKYLKDCTIGIDAAYFLQYLPQEHLLSALGGAPLSLDKTVKDEIEKLQNAGFQLHFVFHGLASGIGEDPITKAAKAASLNGDAFKLYEEQQLTQAHKSFGNSTLSDTNAVTAQLKKTLYEERIPFTVAPYSALAQLVYYEKHPSQFIDAVYGPSELFCFGIDKIITRFAPETSSFWWINRRDCLTELGNISSHTFIDALMLAGSDLLRPFPPLLDSATHRKGFIIRHIADLIASSGGSVSKLCKQHLTTSPAKETYLDEYKKAATRVKHHVIINAEGDVEILDKDHAPDDAHDCIGLRLPEELYMYLSRGMLRPRALNWLTSATVAIGEPLAGGDSAAYQKLVKTQLDGLRRQALKLLTEPIHRYYQSREITTRLWFETDLETKFNMKEVPSSRDLLSKWHVGSDLVEEYTKFLDAGTFQFAMVPLENADYAAKTITTKSKTASEPLKHRSEVLANTVWRFLHLRGYVDEKHRLTDWGEILKSALYASDKDQEESIFIAVELLRLGLVNPDTMFLGYSGAPEHGSDIDKRNCMLVSRLACIGQFQQHEPKGWSGPLSRHLLAYQSIVSSLHSCLRDLLEMVLAAMFLEGLVDRDRDDWAALSLGLPFYQEHSCGLGVATMHYLDDLCGYPNPTLNDSRSEVRARGQDKFPHVNYSGSLDDAFKIWDALYQAVGVAGDKIDDRKMWDEVNTWLSQRR